jgi:hypothetical protein
LYILIKYFEGYIFNEFICAYDFIDKNFYLQNKKRIDQFINQDEFICRYYFKKNSVLNEMVEIFVEQVDVFEYFVEHMFRVFGKDVITYVGICVGFFDDLKEMYVVIPEIKEKMWEVPYKYGHFKIALAKANDYKLIELLNDYDMLFLDDDESDGEAYTRRINDKISEYRGINNEKPYHTPFFINLYVYINKIF